MKNKKKYNFIFMPQWLFYKRIGSAERFINLSIRKIISLNWSYNGDSWVTTRSRPQDPGSNPGRDTNHKQAVFNTWMATARREIYLGLTYKGLIRCLRKITRSWKGNSIKYRESQNRMLNDFSLYSSESWLWETKKKKKKTFVEKAPTRHPTRACTLK